MENKKKFWLCNGCNIPCTALSSIKPPVVDGNCFSDGWHEVSKEVYDSVVKRNIEKTCKLNKSGYYNGIKEWDILTGCGHYNKFSEEELKDFKYCPYCGGKIEIER